MTGLYFCRFLPAQPSFSSCFSLQGALVLETFRSTVDLIRYQTNLNQCKSRCEGHLFHTLKQLSSVFDFFSVNMPRGFNQQQFLFCLELLAWIRSEKVGLLQLTQPSCPRKPTTNPDHKPLLLSVWSLVCPTICLWSNPPLPASVSWRCR